MLSWAFGSLDNGLETKPEQRVENPMFTGRLNMPGCKACEIPRNEAYKSVRRVTRDEQNAADGRLSTA